MYVPKIIKFGGDLTEVLTKTTWFLFWAHPVLKYFSENLYTWLFSPQKEHI